MPHRFAILLSLLAALSGCGEDEPVRLERGDQGKVAAILASEIETLLRKQDVAGLSIALIDDQRIVWAKGFGVADRASGRPATSQTLYRAGSLAKVFTCLLLLKMRDEGQLGLDQTLAEVLPGFAMKTSFLAAAPLTLRALAAHHGGLPGDQFRGMWARQPGTLAGLLRELEQEFLAAPPQSQYRYSNLGFSVLGRALEVRAGQAFEALIERDLLPAMGMPRSRFSASRPEGQDVATGHGGQGAWPWLALRDTPAGGLTTSVWELAQLPKLIFAGGLSDGRRVVSPASIRDSLEPQFPGLALDFGHRVGLPWMLSGVRTAAGDAVVWHDGFAPPFNASLVMLPRDKLAVVVLANSEGARPFVLPLATRALSLLQTAKAGGIHQFPSPPKSQTIPATRQQMEGYAGDYVVVGQRLTLQAVDGGLRSRFRGQDFELRPTAAGHFILQTRLLGLFGVTLPDLGIALPEPGSDAPGRLTGLPAPIPVTRLPAAVISRAWQNRLGECQVDDDGEYFSFASCALEREGQHLLLRVGATNAFTGQTEHQAIPLIPDHDRLARVPGHGPNEGYGVPVDGEPGRESLRYSGFRIRLSSAGARPGPEFSPGKE